MKTSDHNYRSVVNCLSKYMMFAQASEMQSSVRSAFLHDSVVPPFFIHSLGLPYCRQTCLWAWLNTSITNPHRCIIKIWTSHACCQCSELWFQTACLLGVWLLLLCHTLPYIKGHMAVTWHGMKRENRLWVYSICKHNLGITPEGIYSNWSSLNFTLCYL